MSNFQGLAWHPEQQSYQHAIWIDDHYGGHRYGIKFPDGKIFPAEQCVVAGEQQRVAVIDTTIGAYMATKGESPQSVSPDEIATDLLTDLKHWCEAKRVDFALCLSRAEMHYEVEKTLPPHVPIEEMVFELIEERSNGPVTETRTFARRTGDRVKSEFHNMRIGEYRPLAGRNHFIVRTQ